jgi:hypothetical protein
LHRVCSSFALFFRELFAVGMTLGQNDSAPIFLIVCPDIAAIPVRRSFKSGMRGSLLRSRGVKKK